MLDLLKKYEVMFLVLFGFVLGIIFITHFGGEYSRGQIDGYSKAQGQWNGMVIETSKRK
jgi:hypothetical protein